MWITGYRTYTTHKFKGKVSLVTWKQRRCFCGKFLSKYGKKFCDKCRKKVIRNNDINRNHTVHRREYNRLWSLKNNEERKLRHFVYWNVDKLNIGDYI